jgi:hypothetical protein
VGGHASQVDSASVQLDEEQHRHRRSQIVSTVKKSQAMIPAACWHRNARQSWPPAEAQDLPRDDA